MSAARDIDDEYYALISGSSWYVFRDGQSRYVSEVSVSLDMEECEVRGVLRPRGGRDGDRPPDGGAPSPPLERRFHPELARFTPDGRFAGCFNGDGGMSLIDLATDRQLVNDAYSVEGLFGVVSSLHRVPGVGQFALVTKPNASHRVFRVLGRVVNMPTPIMGDEGYSVAVWLIPAHIPPLPPETLELWTQVAVRGEVGPDGRLRKLDEPTWDRKRQELAERPAPAVGFAFPGHVATDRLHWLRSEFDDAKSDADKLHLARQLLGRAEAAGDQAGAVRWRAQLDKLNPSPQHPQ